MPAKPKGLPPCVVVDIDRTITDARFHRQTSHKAPLVAAPDALRKIKADGIKIIYLSKRFEWNRAETVQWLATCGFPGAEDVVLRKDVEEDGDVFKLRELGEIQKKFHVLCGFGNPDDDEIYRRAGIKSMTRDPWRDEDWADVPANATKLP